MKTIVVCALLCIGVALAAEEVDDDEPAVLPIPLAEIHERGVEGGLGVRLGTIVTVSGTVVPNTSDSKRDVGVPFFLSITSVDGRKLEEPVLYRFHAQSGANVKVEPPQIDDRFGYVAYETGRFIGSPDGEFDYVRAYASEGYHFETSLVVLAAER